MATIKRRFYLHRKNSEWRKIPFRLTFDQWLKIWTKSGHLYESGKRKGEYCMARRRDRGAYEVGNVRIVTVEKNHSEMRHSAGTRAKMKRDRTGIKNSNYRHGGRVRSQPEMRP